jgi:hypothetical protein
MYRLSSRPTLQEQEAAARGENPLVDPRVAKRGGWRTNPKSNYDFPGMSDRRDWCKTQVHKATSFYGCAHCGTKFSSPHAVYTHLAKIHER